MFSWRRAWPLALLIAFGFAACRRLPPADLTVLNGAEPSSLDPLLVTGIEELRAVLPLFEGLTRPDPATARAIPGVANRWDVSPDGRIYTFHFRSDAIWSTGEPITASDLLYSWRRVLEPTNACQYANLLFPVRGAEDYVLGRSADFSTVGIREIDPVTVQVELGKPCAYFLDLCALQTLSIVPRRAIERYGDRWILLARPLPVSGPYELEFWRLNDRVRLRRNDRYWDAANTSCRIVDLLSVTAPNTVLNLYLNRQADIIFDKPLVPTELMPELQKRSDYHAFPVLGTYFLRLNVTRPPFNDVRVRRALALATDKQRLTQRVTASGEESANHMVPTVTAHYSRGRGQQYNPDEARRLLAEAGISPGSLPEIDYLFDSAAGGPARIHERVAVELKEMWARELGIRLELRRMEKKSYLIAQRGLDYGVSRSSWIGDYNDPTTFLELFMTDNGNNRTGWSNSAYDQMMRDAAQEPDLQRRADLLRDAETLLVRDEVPVIPLWFDVGFALFRPEEIDGIHANALDTHPLNAIKRLRGR